VLLWPPIRGCTYSEGMILADFRVNGRPRTKGSLKTYCMKDAKHTVRVQEEVAESKSWRMRVARASREYQLAEFGALRQFGGAVEVRIVMWFPREQAVNGGPIPSHDTPWPVAITIGDVDKLARNVLDALSLPTKRAHIPLTSGLIRDDSQVVSLAVLKFWETEENPAGMWILVTDVTEKAEGIGAKQAESLRVLP